MEDVEDCESINEEKQNSQFIHMFHTLHMLPSQHDKFVDRQKNTRASCDTRSMAQHSHAGGDAEQKLRQRQGFDCDLSSNCKQRLIQRQTVLGSRDEI